MSSLFTRVRDWFRTTPTLFSAHLPIPPDMRECECGEHVNIWRTYANGKIYCVDCADVREGYSHAKNID